MRASRPSMVRALRLAALVASLVLAPALARAEASEPWATTRARTLVDEGRALATAGQGDAAIRRFLDALQVDGTFAPAYLALGAARERGGDMREAERAYSLGIERVPGFWEALVARAHVRHAMGRVDDALSDLEAAASVRPDDVGLLMELAAWEVSRGRFASALARYRAVRRLLENGPSQKARSSAAIQIRALRALTAEADALQSGSTYATRRAIEGIARRDGLLLPRAPNGLNP